MSEFTLWFPAHVKPVRKGVYERDSLTGKYSYWNGKKWCMGFRDFDEVKMSKACASYDQSASWRGLAKNPNA